MQGRIIRELTPVRDRQGKLFVLRATVFGLLASSVIGMGLGAWRWAAGSTISPLFAAAILGAGPILGACLGVFRRRGWHGAATAVDTHYRLKDRAATALDFLAKPQSATPVHELQMEDAELHLAQVEATKVVPYRAPRSLPVAVAALAAAIALLAWPLPGQRAKAGPSTPLPQVLEQAEVIAQELNDLDEQAKKEKDKDLERLVQNLLDKVEEMKKPGVDVKEAMAKLSEMQTAIAAQQAVYNVGLVDVQLQSLGEAMSAAESLDAASQALQNGKFEKAADKLERLEDVKLERKEAKAVEEKMKKTAKKMREVGLGQLGDSTDEMSEGLIDGDGTKIKNGSKGIAKAVRTHAKRKKIKGLLTAQSNKLSECKSKCQMNSLAKGKNPQRSKSPSSTFGKGTSGVLFGDKTDPGSKRDLKEVTGKAGDGPSESETTHSPEGRQQASVAYKEVYKKYQKMSEAVLDSEPIPLGHRQTIRKYFELIRPNGAEAEKVDQPEGTPSASPDPSAN